MKVTVRGVDVILDLSDEDEEVADYVLDQFEDRFTADEIIDVMSSSGEVFTNSKLKQIEVTNLMQELAQKIIEEKKADIDHERRHGERE